MPSHKTLMLKQAAAQASRSSMFDLPPDLLEKARNRLSVLASLSTGMSVFGIIVQLTLGEPGYRSNGMIIAVFIYTIAASVGLWVACRSRRVSDRRVLQLGLAYQVTACLVISIGVPWGEWVTRGQIPSLTWASILIAIFPILIPSRPLTTVVVALASALMVPAGLGILQLAGVLTPEGPDYVLVSLSPLLCVALSVASSRVMYGLSQQMAEALQLGAYELEERLGQGGMGEVWRARHRLLARPAAVKLINPESLAMGSETAESAVRRFEREAQATAALESEHTVHIHDYGVNDEGICFYVMELLDGLDLDALVTDFGPVRPARAVHILRQVCHSLAEAHSRGLIHRDIKPANIYLCRKGLDLDFVKVLDFGLVKRSAVTEASQASAALTLEGNITGTPAFMAPEMALGQPDVDGRADLYALGCVGYWLVSGALVFDGDNAMQILMAHAKDTPPALESRTEHPLPDGLAELIHACLAKDPQARPQTAQELDDRLAALPLEHPWTQSSARRWWDTHRP